MRRGGMTVSCRDIVPGADVGSRFALQYAWIVQAPAELQRCNAGKSCYARSCDAADEQARSAMMDTAVTADFRTFHKARRVPAARHAAGDRSGRLVARRPRRRSTPGATGSPTRDIDELADGGRGRAPQRRRGRGVRREIFPLTALAERAGRRPARADGRPRHGDDAELPDRPLRPRRRAIAYLGLGTYLGRPCRRTGRATSSAT